MPENAASPAPSPMRCYDALARAKYDKEQAEKRIAQAEKEIQQQEMALRKAMPVSKPVPCNAGVLPDGKVAVHVWVESSSEPNQLHIVPAGYFTHDGRARKQFANEQLGDGQSSYRFR